MSQQNLPSATEAVTALLMFVGVIAFILAVVFGVFTLADFGPRNINIALTISSAVVALLSLGRGVVRINRQR